MAAHAPQDTLRRVDNALLAEYAETHGLFPNLDIKALKQTQIDPIYEAIQELDTAERERVERDLRNVATVAEKRCIQQLHAALKFEGHDFPAFEKQRVIYDKAMWALIHHPEVFSGVLKYSFPHTEQRQWQKFPYPSGHPPTLNKDTCEKLSSSISHFFRVHDGRGEHCRVEHHNFQDYEYLFAYPSEYRDQPPVWLDSGAFEHLSHRPAFVVIYVFKKAGEAVELYVREALEIKRDLFALWAKEILGLEEVDTNPKRRHVLTAFHSQEHGLKFAPDNPVESFAIYKIRFSPRHNPKSTYTVEADISENRHAVYDELNKKYLHVHHIKKLGIEATLQGKRADEKITRRFEISPHTCSLNHVDEADAIRQCLKNTGIDTTL